MSRRRRSTAVDRTIGGFFLVMAGINIGLVVADADVYRHFADASYLDFVVDGWRSVVMTHPGLWIGLLAAGEVAIGAALLAGRSWTRLGYAAAIVFHLLLMLFGWGIWVWSVPAIVLLAVAARSRSATSPAEATA